MNNIVDKEAKQKALQKWITGTAYLEKPENINFALLLAAFDTCLETYEQAKLDNQKAAYVDDREPSLPKPALPELPLPWEIPEKWSFVDISNSYDYILEKQNQLITCLAAVYKELQERS